MLLNGLDLEHVRRAAERLAAGELVGMPTETVYGLGARADEDQAVTRIFEAKGRPADHPLIVHVLDAEEAAHFSGELNDLAKRLMAAFWPGPMTVIVARAPGVAEAAAGGQSTVGLRSPSHPVARALLKAARQFGVRGIAAPSANRFGHVSPTTADHVASEFGANLLILDGGACEVGIESSIVDCSRTHPVLLRPGTLSRQEIEAAIGEPLRAPDLSAPRASGTLKAHYAPRAVVHLLSRSELRARLTQGRPQALAVYARGEMPDAKPGEESLLRQMSDEPRVVAQELFAVLRAFDDAGAQEIWIEEPPDSAEWEGVRDRLSRAAAAFAD